METVPVFSPPKLAPDEVHLWSIALESDSTRLEALHSLLTDDERNKAAHFHFQNDRQHFIVARAALRRVLGGYLNVAPARLRFAYNPYGKPALVQAGHLQFNLSHSHGVALLGVTYARSIGVDIERVHDDFPCLAVAKSFFSPHEQAVLTRLPPAAQYEAFFNCWTRKEAYVKARGEGLSMSLGQFDVSLAPGEPACLLHTRPDAGEAERWTLHAFEPEPGYAAAVAFEACGFQIRQFEIDWANLGGVFPVQVLRE